MMSDAICWGASQLMLPSSSSWGTWWGCHTSVFRSIFHSNQHTQPSFAVRWMLILSSSIPSAALSAGLLEQCCPRDWVVHWWNKRGNPFPKQGIKREHKSPWKYAAWNQCAGMPVLRGRLEVLCHHSLSEGGTQEEYHAVTQEGEAAQTWRAGRKIHQRYCCQVHRCVELKNPTENEPVMPKTFNWFHNVLRLDFPLPWDYLAGNWTKIEVHVKLRWFLCSPWWNCMYHSRMFPWWSTDNVADSSLAHLAGTCIPLGCSYQPALTMAKISSFSGGNGDDASEVVTVKQ